MLYNGVCLLSTNSRSILLLRFTGLPVPTTARYEQEMIVELDRDLEVSVQASTIKCNYWIEMSYDVSLAPNIPEHHEVSTHSGHQSQKGREYTHSGHPSQKGRHGCAMVYPPPPTLARHSL
eukprot:1664655-Pyramimonas_sp.AAC.1